MENTSKALIMAGSILISMVIIAALILMFNSLGALKKTELDSETASKLLKYEQQIEGYCKPGLYGSELVSLANLIDDYNKRQADFKGYTAIQLEIKTKAISLAKYMKNYYTDYNQLITDFNNIEKQINTLKNKTICGQTIEKISGMRTLEIERIVNNYNATSSKKYKVEEVEAQKDAYLAIKSEYTTFKNKRFAMPEVVQDKNNGRIAKITFIENGL